VYMQQGGVDPYLCDLGQQPWLIRGSIGKTRELLGRRLKFRSEVEQMRGLGIAGADELALVMGESVQDEGVFSSYHSD
jgi:hypothetical protein